MKHANFLTGLVVGALVFGGTSAYAAGILAEYSTNHIFVDGQEVRIEAYAIHDNNYMKLRDIGKAVGFNVYWNAEDGSVQIETDKPYTGEAPAKGEAADDADAMKQDIVDRTNALRKENGVAALRVNDKLMQAAQVRADEMAAHTVYSHTRPNGEKFNTVTDCPYMAENIHRIADWTLSEQTLAEQAVADWNASTTHHKNMLNPKLSEIGIGLARGVNDNGNPCWYCVQLFLYDGYSTLSLGYAGLWECVYSLIEKKLTELEGKKLGLEIMQKLNDYCTKWKEAENIDYSIYGTPLESTTYSFAKSLQRRFGIVKGVTDRNYITNSYHVHVTEPIDAFSKLKLESEFQALSPGGAISYVEVPNMQDNIPAVLQVIRYIYDNIMYAELNTKSDYCQVCGYDGEIKIIEDDGKLVWECPHCGNRDQSKLNVARRTCGYIGTQFWNQGRTQEIKERVLHL